MSREYFGSDGGGVNETGSRQYFRSDSGIANETTSVGGAINLEATPTVISTSTAGLTTSVVLYSSAVAVATSTAALTDGGMSSTASIIATVAANLTTAIRLLASGAGISAATAALSTTPAVRFSTPVLKNNTGTVLANETDVIVNVYNSTTGALVLRKTGLTSSALGVVEVIDITGVLVAATTYSYEVVLTSNGRRLPTASAA